MASGDLVSMRVRMKHLYWMAEINLGFRLLTDSADPMAELAEEWLGTIGHVWVAPCTTEVRVDALRLEWISPSGADMVEVVPTDPLVGTQLAQVAPHSCAALLRWTTGLQGIGGRGRSFLYGFRADQIQYGQFWGEDAKEHMRIIGEAMLLRFGPAGFSPTARFVVLNRRRDNAVLDPPEATQVNGFTVVELLASQRGRIYNVPE